MEPVKVFSGNVIEAGAAQQLLNDNKIGTWVKNSDSSAILGEGFELIEIYVDPDLEEKAKLVLEFNQSND